MALDGKVAVVTGAAMGIGKAVTEILLQNGAKVTAALSFWTFSHLVDFTLLLCMCTTKTSMHRASSRCVWLTIAVHLSGRIIDSIPSCFCYSVWWFLLRVKLTWSQKLSHELFSVLKWKTLKTFFSLFLFLMRTKYNSWLVCSGFNPGCKQCRRERVKRNSWQTVRSREDTFLRVQCGVWGAGQR